MTADGIDLRRATDIDTVWQTLIDVYAEVRADQLHLPHYSVERYGERLARHGAEPGWEAVVGYDGDEPIGYAYINTIDPEDRWWRRMSTPLPEGIIERTTVALKEIMLRTPWRGIGAARRIHDALLTQRTEEQVTLLVNPQNGDGKVKALYQQWGYREVNTQQPSADGPLLTAMLCDIRPASKKTSANRGVS